MWALVGALVLRAIGAMTGRAALIGAGGAVVADIVNLDWLRQEAFKIAPGSDKEALEEASRTVMRMLGLQGDDVLWPRLRDGTPITPRYFVLDIGRGRAWYSGKYYSRKSVRAGARRGAGRGFGRGQRSIATISQAQGR